jgi:hypothetical protein
VAIFIIERIDVRAGTKSLAPLVIAGALSILYWRQALLTVHLSFSQNYFLSFFHALHFLLS